VINKRDWYLCKILFIAGKKAITENWYKSEPPGLKEWMDLIKEIFIIENMTFSLRSRGAIFPRKWMTWTVFISEE